jgi:hypothetical protein
MTQAMTVSNYTVPDMERMALAFAASKLFGISTPDQALALCLVAQAEGRHPASAAQDYHIIQGRPSKKADAMLRDFLSSGGKVEWHALSDEIADATFSHPAGGSVRISWDMPRVKKAGIKNADMYGKFPRQMLRSRTVSEGVRTVFPMATSGMYVPEEVQEFDTPAKPTLEAPANTTANMPMIDGEVTERKSSAQAKRDGDWEALKQEVDACQTLEALNMLVASRMFQDAVKPLPRQWVKELQDYVQETRDGFASREPIPPNFDELEPENAGAQ